ncbi:MAG: hypothetical protein J6A56_01240, partial [Clostridia bacterium]|nr:hypothetical protein [Clostridia bacterium]
SGSVGSGTLCSIDSTSHLAGNRQGSTAQKTAAEIFRQKIDLTQKFFLKKQEEYAILDKITKGYLSERGIYGKYTWCLRLDLSFVGHADI